MIEESALRLDDPLVAQISRWDRLRDPLGILQAFAEHVDDADEPHLLLAGPDVRAVSDDPEGATVLAECEDAWRALTITAFSSASSMYVELLDGVLGSRTLG